MASEFREAVEEVIQGFRDERDREREALRSLAALKMWKRFLVGLRIKQRVDGYAIEGEEEDANAFDEGDESEGTEYIDEDEYGGGGFITDDDDGGGGFIPE